MSAAFPATIPVRLDAEGRIDIDVHCPACDYNLRMQKVQGACPECGAAVDVVERDDADRLANADPAWLARVRRGTRWLHGAAVAALCGGIPGVVWGAAALWLLTGREPGRRETWYHRGTRLSARWASVLAAAAALAVVVLIVRRYGSFWSTVAGSMGSGAGSGGGTTNPLLRVQRLVAPMMSGDWGTFDLLVCTAAASMAVAMLEAWRHLFALAARADGPAVAQHCRRAWKRYLIAVGIVVAIAVGTNVVERFGWRLPGGFYEWTALMLSGVILLVLLWVWWVTVRLTWDFRRLVARAHAD